MLKNYVLCLLSILNGSENLIFCFFRKGELFKLSFVPPPFPPAIDLLTKIFELLGEFFTGLFFANLNYFK